MRISEFMRSGALKPEDVRIAVTLPTFRRPDHLVATLDSLAAQSRRKGLAILVMENDDEGLAGARAASDWLNETNAPGMVIIAHERGNCHAYNAGWRTARETFPNLAYLAVIDDDEIACPNWIENLVDTAEKTGAAFVGGPQVPVFAGNKGGDWRHHPVFTPHYSETGPVPVLYSSGNVLISAAVLADMPEPYLDPGFNFIGGGDSDFYRRSRAHGFTFAWCAEAPVMETVPERRAGFSWVNARSLRNGAISAIIEKRQNPGTGGRLKTFAKSLALLAASPLRGIQLGWKTGSAVIGLYHVQVAIGRLLAEVGIVNEQYRNPEAN